MMSAAGGGLSRRRNLNAQSSSNPGLDEYSQPPAIESASPKDEAVEDWDDDKKGGRSLTLMEELLLLGLKDSQVSPLP